MPKNHRQITKDVRALRRMIGDNIHRARMKKRMTLQQLSRKSGLPSYKLDAFEIGKYDIGFHHIVKIARALKLNSHDILKF